MPHRDDVDLTSLYAEVRAEMSRLCLALESLADALHDNGSRQNCLFLARSIWPTVARCHRVEENILFPAVIASARPAEAIRKAFETLRLDHYEDECFAEELQEALLGFGSGTTKLSADAIGYMLRGFFLAKRRHLAFEEQVLGPLIAAGAAATDC